MLSPAARHAEFIPPEPAAAEGAQEVVRASAATVWTRGLTEVVPGLFATGEIPRDTPFEDTGGAFFPDEPCEQPDPLADDQALFCETQDGLVVLLGCAHAGVVNTLLHIERLTGGKRIHALLGGMHLLNASPERMNRTLAALEQRDIHQLAPAHCTGLLATARLWTAFSSRCSSCAAGTSRVFQKQQADPPIAF